ncbi:MAG: glycosyltransferase family 4 protein [Actinomycetota bacterium]|nr:glycosyltransferase family 4 protein [Actinomycetota bacterium]
MAIKTRAAQSGQNQVSVFDEIHIIGTAIGVKGTLDSDARATLELARGWADLGAPVTLYTDHTGYLLAQDHDLHNVVYRVWPTERWRRFGRVIHPMAKSLIGWMYSRRIKTNGLIYSASNSWADLFASQQARRLNPGARWVSGIKTIDPKYLIRYAANAVMTSQIERNADLVFAVGGTDRARLDARFGGRSHRLRLGIDPMVMQARAGKRKRYDACFIAANESIRGWAQLANAWRHVRTYRPDAKLAIMVSGPQSVPPLVKHLFAKRELADDISWSFNPDEVARQKTLLASRIFISSFTDTNSLLIGEAMAAGLPVIGFESPALTVDYQIGRMTVPIGDWASLGHLLIHILNHRGLYLRLKKQAKAEASTRDWNHCAGQALEFIRAAF